MRGLLTREAPSTIHSSKAARPASIIAGVISISSAGAPGSIESRLLLLSLFIVLTQVHSSHLYYYSVMAAPPPDPNHFQVARRAVPSPAQRRTGAAPGLARPVSRATFFPSRLRRDRRESTPPYLEDRNEVTRWHWTS